MLENKLNKTAKVCILYDQPSAEDDSARSHFNEKLMAKASAQLMAVGIIPSQHSILTYCQERHPKINKITAGERLCWTEILRRDLRTINPNLIITIGELAFQAMTGKRDHEKYRGSVIPSILNDCKVLSLWSPDAVSNPKTPWMKAYNVRPEWQPFTQWDCQKALRHSATPDYLEPTLEMVMVENRNDFHYLDEFLAEDYVNDPTSRLACDIEASYCEMTCIGFARTNTRAVVVDLVHMSEKDLPYALLLINKVLCTQVRKVFQNGNFDVLYLAYYYHIRVNNFYWDTMLAFHALFPNLPKGLGILGSIFTETPYWKDESKGDDEKQWLLPHSKVHWPSFFLYNAKDTANLLTIWDGEQQLLNARGTWETFRREMRLCYPLLTIEYYGTQINHAIKTELAVKLEAQITAWTIFLYWLVPRENQEEGEAELLELIQQEETDSVKKKLAKLMPVNPNSPKGLADFLYVTMRLPRRIKKGKVSTDIDALTSLVHLNPIVMKTIMIFRDLKKQRSFTRITTGSDGRVRCTFKPGGTQTGRLSSSRSITGTGTNLQQQPKWAREFYVPDQDEPLYGWIKAIGEYIEQSTDSSRLQ